MDEYKIVDTNELSPGPIQHQKLPENWYNEAISIYALISEVEGGSFEKFEENFRRDISYEKEITIWRCIATAYSNFVTARIIISLPEKEAAYGIALMCSISFNNENDVKGDALISEADAKFIYKTYRYMISQTYANRRNGR
jgi:hypothetical protein